MANYAVCDKIRAELRAEIDALDSKSPVLTANKKTKEDIKKAIPTSYDLEELNSFWWLIRQELDPTDEKNAEVEILSEVKAAVRTKRLELYALAEKEADDFIKGAVEASSYYMDRALACETVAELESLCAELESLKTDTGAKYSKYFYSAANTEWGKGFYGMLVSPNGEGIDSVSLYGALDSWNAENE